MFGLNLQIGAVNEVRELIHDDFEGGTGTKRRVVGQPAPRCQLMIKGRSLPGSFAFLLLDLFGSFAKLLQICKFQKINKDRATKI